MCLSLKNTSQFSCVLFSSSSSNQPPHLNQAVYVKIKDWYVWTLGIYILLIFGPVCVDSSLENIDIASFFKIISNPICLPIFSFIFPFSVFFFHFFAQVQLFSCLLVWSLKSNLSLLQETTLYFWLCLEAYFWPIFSLLFSLLEPFAARKQIYCFASFLVQYHPVWTLFYTFDLNTFIIFACLAPFALTD